MSESKENDRPSFKFSNEILEAANNVVWIECDRDSPRVLQTIKVRSLLNPKDRLEMGLSERIGE